MHDSNKKTLSTYLIGFFVSLILTIASFGVVICHALSPTNSYVALAVLACLQLIVQATCFLRLNTSSEGRDNFLTFVFTILVIVIIVVGSLWIMYNLDYNMM